MRRVFAALGCKPDPLHQPLMLGLQIVERRGLADGGDHGAWLAPAEGRQPVEA